MQLVVKPYGPNIPQGQTSCELRNRPKVFLVNLLEFNCIISLWNRLYIGKKQLTAVFFWSCVVLIMQVLVFLILLYTSQIPRSIQNYILDYTNILLLFVKNMFMPRFITHHWKKWWKVLLYSRSACSIAKSRETLSLICRIRNSSTTVQ
jgi:hypothetical protein